MTWVRIDDQFFNHHKVMELTNQAKLLFVASLCHANAQLTDGFVSGGAARALAGSLGIPTKASKELVDAGFWHKQEAGYSIHDYLEYQLSAKQIRVERDKAKERMQRLRSGRGSGEQPPEQSGGVPPTGSPSPTPTPISTSSRSCLQVDVGHGSETENEKATDIAVRIDALLARSGKHPPPKRTAAIVKHASQHLDLATIDEAVGYLETLREPPRSQNYVVRVIADWAGQRGISFPPMSA